MKKKSATPPRPPAPTIQAKRAIWGLVNDGYGLVARTPNITSEEAFELCRVPDIGDPTAYLDEGLAFLASPSFGYVFARYFTNADRDTAGRASLVYDVIALSADDFGALRGDPFSAFPPPASDRRPEHTGELAPPLLMPRGAAGERARLSSLLKKEDAPSITLLLASLLAGDHVLWVAGSVRAETLECLVLLLPTPLRRLLTFQTLTVDYPKHAPRLTVAERVHATLAEREWSAVIPRDATDPRIANAVPVAERLLTLGRTPERLAKAHDLYENFASRASLPTRTHLGAEVERLLRFDALLEGMRVGDLRRSTLTLARANDAREEEVSGTLLLQHSGPEQLAEALSHVIRGNQRGAWAAAHSLARTVDALRDANASLYEWFFRALMTTLRDLPINTDDPTALELRVLLADAAASIGDVEAFLDFAEVGLPWDVAAHAAPRSPLLPKSQVEGGTDSSGAPAGEAVAPSPASKSRARDDLEDASDPMRVALRRVRNALALKGRHSVPEAIDVFGSLLQLVAAGVSERARGRVAALALGFGRRALREGAVSDSIDRLRAMIDALARIWSQCSSQSEEERAIRRFLGLTTIDLSMADPRRLAMEVLRVTEIGPGEPEEHEAELLGWSLALLQRVRTGAVHESGLNVIGALIHLHRELKGDAGVFSAQLGQALLAMLEREPGLVFHPAWRELLGRIEATVRGELLTRGLSWVSREYAQRRFTFGDFADACLAFVREGARLDEASVTMLVPHLTHLVASDVSATELSLVLGLLAEVTSRAGMAELSAQLLEPAPQRTRSVVQLRRLARALDDVERVRDEDVVDEWRAALRSLLAEAGALPRDEARVLRDFFGVREGGMFARARERARSLTVASEVADRLERGGST